MFGDKGTVLTLHLYVADEQNVYLKRGYGGFSYQGFYRCVG